MPFQPGESGNPAGRPRGSYGGRTLALRTLDEVLAEEESLQRMRDALRAHLHKEPVRFFKDIIMPLIPKHAVVDAGEERTIRWVSLLQSCHVPGNTAEKDV